MNDFERQIQRQTFRPIPPEWGDEILGRAAQVIPAATPQIEAVPAWRVWLWPSPVAWGALAAIWTLLLGLGAALESPEPFPASPATFAQSTNLSTLTPSPAVLLAYLADPDSALSIH